MAATSQPQNGSVQHWVIVGQETLGGYTARAAGLHDVVATAATREEALRRVHDLLGALLASGHLVALEVLPANPLLQGFGGTDPNDPHEQAYLEELARFRQEDLAWTLRELEQPCSNSSSTPTT